MPGVFTYNFRWARFFIQVNETLVIVVTPGAQEAHLPRAFVEDRRILESLLLGQHAARGILLLVEEVQVVAMVRDQEGLVLWDKHAADGPSLLPRSNADFFHEEKHN